MNAEDGGRRADGASGSFGGPETPLYRGRTRTAVNAASVGTGDAETGAAPAATSPVTSGRTGAVDDRGAERLVSAFFLLSAAGGIAFFVVYWIHTRTDNFVNGLLGTTMAIAFGGIGVGAILWAKKLMPAEEAVQEREPFGSPPEDAEAAATTWNAGVQGSGIARRPLLRRSLLLASGTLALPLIAPLRSLGEKPKGQLKRTRWTPNARMVLADGTPVKLGDLEYDSLASLFPEGHTDTDAAADSAVMMIRLPDEVITDKIRPKSAHGHVVFSKICTHAGCPASLYSQQTHTMVCPCHLSQFEVLRGCKPVAGPATRSLPQLAITVDSDGYFRALRDFDEPIGPGFWERNEH